VLARTPDASFVTFHVTLKLGAFFVDAMLKRQGKHSSREGVES